MRWLRGRATRHAVERCRAAHGGAAHAPRALQDSYQAKVIRNFRWARRIDAKKTMAETHPRTDTRLKNYPYRPRPISGPLSSPGD